MVKIVSKQLAKVRSNKESEKLLAQMQELLAFTQEHLEKNDHIKSIIVKNETHSLMIQENG